MAALWEFTAGAEAAVRDLVARESRCCGFFTFTVTPVPDAVRVDVTVPDAYVGVLDGLAARAAGVGP